MKFVLMILDGSPHRVIINKMFSVVEDSDSCVRGEADDSFDCDDINHIENVSVDDVVVINGIFHYF